jgi:hypothetical protein
MRDQLPNHQQINQMRNAAIAPNATVNGFLVNWSGANNKPTAFTLDNTA